LSAGFVDGDKVVTVDATGESSRDLALSQFTGSVHNLIAQRLDTPLKPVQVAALTGSTGLYFAARKPLAWGQFFGGKLDRDAEASAVGYDTTHGGVNFGYEWDVNSTRVGLMGGFSKGKTEADTASFKTLTDSYYIGAYGSVKLGRVNLTTSLLAGVSDSDNERLVIDNLNGAEVAHADVSSRFISPSVRVDAAFKITDKVELRPSMSVNYSVAFMDNYQETGTTSSNLTVADRTLQVFTTRAQLAAAYPLDAATELEFRAGVSARNGSSDDVDARVAGNAFSYSNAGDENAIGGFVGSRLRIAARDNLNLLVDLELGGDSNERFVNGQVRLDYKF
jgi:outer membrane autotransporter protein